jgi:hypothetical protein
VNGSFEDDQVVIRMSKAEANGLLGELFYTIDYMPEQYPEYASLEAALHEGLKLA